VDKFLHIFLYINALLCLKMRGKAARMNAGIGAAAAKRCNRFAKQQLQRPV
jgi:hypothetical protein